MNKRLILTRNKLVEYYVKKKINSLEIARKLNCCQATVLKRLRKMGIKIRHRKDLTDDLTKEKLEKLYIRQGLSTWKIGAILKHSRGTIYSKLKEFGIKPRDISDSHITYPRKSFNQNPIEKAYMIGFALGDLRIRKTGEKSKTIKVDCGSSRPEQIRLIHGLFRNYGRVWIGKPKKEGKVQIEAHLDESFNFLLHLRENLKSIFSKDSYFASFLAGFIDADGSIYISDGMAKFSIGNYDHRLLRLIRRRLLNYGIEIPKIVKDKKLYVNSEGYKRNDYYHHLNIGKKDSLIKLFDLIGHHLRHEKRLSDMQKAIDNIRERDELFN